MFPKVVVHFSCLFGSYSLFGWVDYEGRLLFIMSIGSLMMYKGCYTIFTVREGEFLCTIIIVLVIETCGLID